MITRSLRERPVEDLDRGDHVCLAFADDAEQRRVVSAYLSAGLSRGERVLYFADQQRPSTVLSWLRSAGVDPGPALTRGQLRVVTADDSYLAAGGFDAATMVETLEREVDASLAAGYTGFRVSGEMGWGLRGIPGADQLAAYETAVNAVFESRPASAICQYDARLFSPAELRVFDRCHPGAVELEPVYRHGLLRIVPAFRDGERALRVVGTVDLRTTGALVDALEAALRWPGDVVVDMGALEFIDLAGLRALAHAARRLPAGRRLRVVDLAPPLCHVIGLAGFDRHPALVVTPRGAGA